MNLIESIDKYKNNMLKEEKNYIYEKASEITLLTNIEVILKYTEDEELFDSCNQITIKKILDIYHKGGYKIAVYNEKTLKEFLNYKKESILMVELNKKYKPFIIIEHQEGKEVNYSISLSISKQKKYINGIEMRENLKEVITKINNKVIFDCEMDLFSIVLNNKKDIKTIIETINLNFKF